MSNSTNIAFGMDTINELAQSGASAMEELTRYMRDLARLGIEANPVLQQITESQRRSSCDIPPPCWLPRSLGEVRSVTCAGGTARLRIRVTNCQPRVGQVQLSVSPADSLVEIDPESALLEPMERGWFNIKLSAPADACKGSRYEVLLWVHGCNAHYLRWILEVSDAGRSSCHEVEIEDCPDYVHHWYDHFYCARPCFHQRGTSTDNRG